MRKMPPLKNMRYFKIGLLYVLAVFLLLISGCVPEDAASENVTIEETEIASSEAVEEEPETAATVEIEDMAGRLVTIPTSIESVFGSNNNSSILLYTLAPEKMVAWNLDFSNAAKAYMLEGVVDLPVLGNLYGNGKMANIEEIVALNPDIVLITDVKINDKVKEAADELQDKLGLPVVVVYANLHNYNEAYEFLGSILDAEDKAAQLSDYYKEAYDEAVEISSAIEDKKTIYYATLDNGLTTEFAGSPNAELIELVGGINVAETEGSEVSGEVTIEQILVWNPEVILVGHKGAAMSEAYNLIKTDEVWAEVAAVKSDNVINVPRFPFNWFDRPPSVNRILGIKWLGNTLYPETYDYDMDEEIKEFFSLFYGCELSDEDVEKLLGS